MMMMIAMMMIMNMVHVPILRASPVITVGYVNDRSSINSLTDFFTL